MFTKHKTLFTLLSGAVIGAVILFGIEMAVLNPLTTPVMAQAQPASTSTPMVSSTLPGPGVGEGIGRESNFFINDLANRLNVNVANLESAITGALNDTISQAVKDGFVTQATANQLSASVAILLTAGNGFFFSFNALPSTVLVPVTGATATPTSVPTNTATVPAPAVAPCFSASFVEDVTVPDGSEFSAGADFSKTWRIQNTGSCTWTTAFQLIFDHGDQMGGPSSVNLPNTVFPGQTVDVSVDQTAPDSKGTFEGFWRLEAANGTIFGGDFTDEIVVTSSLTINSIDLSVDNSHVTTTCPPGNTFTVTATINIDGTGDVRYFWEFSNDTRTDEHTLTFNGSTERTFSTDFTVNHTGSFWARLQITGPTSKRSDRVNFSLTCQAPASTRTPSPTRTPVPSATPTLTPTLTPTP